MKLVCRKKRWSRINQYIHIIRYLNNLYGNNHIFHQHRSSHFFSFYKYGVVYKIFGTADLYTGLEI